MCLILQSYYLAYVPFRCFSCRLTLLILAIVIFREKAMMQWGFFEVFGTPLLLVCKCSIFFLP
jgi:hypothetical protein